MCIVVGFVADAAVRARAGPGPADQSRSAEHGPFVFGPSFLYSDCRQFTHQLGPTCLHVGRGYGRAPHAARHERRPVATLTEDQLRVRSLAWAGEWAQLSVAWTIWRRAGGQLTGR